MTRCVGLTGPWGDESWAGPMGTVHGRDCTKALATLMFAFAAVQIESLDWQLCVWKSAGAAHTLRDTVRRQRAVYLLALKRRPGRRPCPPNGQLCQCSPFVQPIPDSSRHKHWAVQEEKKNMWHSKAPTKTTTSAIRHPHSIYSTGGVRDLRQPVERRQRLQRNASPHLLHSWIT